ncbi:MAG: GNAT family N-acetyltransferase [Clostridiales bacterium]|nr:GNAT family N-acetyltransferase [Clostridiales bacterium]
MEVNYQNLAIRNAEESDASLLCNWWNDGNVMAHAGFPNGLGITAEQVERQIAASSDDRHRVLIMEIDKTPIGEMSFQNTGGLAAEIGIKICKTDMQEKGLGSLFLNMLMTKLFQVGYEKIILDTNLENTRAQHVYEKLGFTKLRVNENAWRDQLGNPQSSVDYEMNKLDFTPLPL